MSDPVRDEAERIVKLIAEDDSGADMPWKDWVKIMVDNVTQALSRREAKGWNDAVEACARVAYNFKWAMGISHSVKDVAEEIRKLLKKEGEV